MCVSFTDQMSTVRGNEQEQGTSRTSRINPGPWRVADVLEHPYSNSEGKHTPLHGLLLSDRAQGGQVVTSYKP